MDYSVELDPIKKDQDQVKLTMSLLSQQHRIPLPAPIDLKEDDLAFAEGRFVQWVVSSR